jgi:hypothetical protein
VISVMTLADPETGGVDDIVDVARYPVHRPGSATWRRLVDDVGTALRSDGLVTLPGFLTPDALMQAADETVAVAPHVAIRRQEASVYGRGDLLGGGADAPWNRRLVWYAGHVTRDMIPPYAVAHRLYVSVAFKRFVAACVGRERVFEYADPLAGLVATVVPPGGQYPWHYDTNEFVVTIMTQQPDGGGRFEYCRDLRTPGHENLEGLGQVLAGDPSCDVQSVDVVPGDLQLFLGRYSLHQVTRVTGSRDRHVLVFSYADRPGVIGPADRTRSVYGRVTEAHLVADQIVRAAGDGLIL